MYPLRPVEIVATLEQAVADRAKAAGILAPGDRVLVAVSGGRDSAATAALLVAAKEHGLPLEITLGHVDHGWRGPAEAKADLAVVRKLGRALGVKVVVAGPPKLVHRTEDSARRHRYTSLEALAERVGASTIVTGHHLRDQAETYAMRLRRGSGPAGLAGIPVRRPLGGPDLEVVRPVLWVEPRRLADYATARDLPWREDPTNALLDRDRAKVRAELIALGERAESEARLLADAADGFAQALARRETDARARLSRSLLVDPEALYVEVAAKDFASLGDAEFSTGLRVMGACVHAGRGGPWFTRRHAEIVGQLARGRSGSLELPRGIIVTKVGPRLTLARVSASIGPALELPHGAQVTHTYAWATIDARWDEIAREAFDLDAWSLARRADPSKPPHRAAFDADRLGARATLRVWTDRDFVLPLGSEKRFSVYQLAVKDGLPRDRNPGLRVLEAEDGGIAWVVGVRVDRRYAITEATTRVATVEVDVRPR